MADSQYGLRKWQQRVEAEFEMPLKEVIRLFIKDGYSRNMAAATMEIDKDTLKRYCLKNKITFPDRMHLRDECKPRCFKRGIVRNPWGRKGKPKKRIRIRQMKSIVGK
jgi:uncharacterized protein YlaI